MNSYEIYVIRALTNMHVGSGDINFNIIDNEVQRDVLTNYPTINASSLKGAIREFFNGEGEEKLIKKVFGDKDDGEGTYKFFSGMLLSIPVRSNKQQFFRAICPRIVKEFITFTEDFKVEYKYKESLNSLLELEAKLKNNSPLIFKDMNNVKIEEYKAEVNKGINPRLVSNIEKLFGKDIVLFSNYDFYNIVKELPVIARNNLENGMSKNLWYEEIIPRETRFYFGLSKGDEYNEIFSSMLTKNIIQIGANASIGYGYTKIDKIGDIDE
ncbi:type III-B CRISPR module RAMP protein Cmr4 [Clostridium pasteurianum]|uniref:type III-B CRISPR module RAMP protein Cmr4 n=1 Tax=Clostridium pasteurianum TaxID=1501 RepID=UPI002260F7EF|nr:type III-B CRISPR module RAMP protein Cmr4 [Clostridium pasteurianum]UZW14964.1 type III-B CRISPR module RAMP protein Cmr4 [Clostridium pasteurianum]